MLQDMAIRTKFGILLEQKAYRENRTLTYKTVSEETGISVSVLTDYKASNVKRFDAVTLQKLCDYFDCQPGDLLEYVPDD